MTNKMRILARTTWRFKDRTGNRMRRSRAVMPSRLASQIVIKQDAVAVLALVGCHMQPGLSSMAYTEAMLMGRSLPLLCECERLPPAEDSEAV